MTCAVCGGMARCFRRKVEALCDYCYDWSIREISKLLYRHVGRLSG